MVSPAKRHYQRVMAGKSGSTEVASAGAARSGAAAYELMLAKLHTDMMRLRDVQSLERKISVKRELLPEYEAWVTGALESGRGAQDDVLMTLLVWYIDVGDYARALDVATYALSHGLSLPDQYNRSVATVLADEIGGAALAAQRDDAEFPIDALQRSLEITADSDMPDPARAKLHKAIGLALRETSPEDALTHLRRALELHEGAGVKRDITSIEAELKKRAGHGADT